MLIYFVEVVKIETASIILFVVIMLRLMPIGQSYQNGIARISIYDASLSKLHELFDISNRYREVVDEGLALKTIRDGFAFERCFIQDSFKQKKASL